jgi:biopolymer transport protein ExbD/biopolymer transport protein TolR
MAIVTRNAGTTLSSTINVTPMVDVMLVLLIIFMVITPMLRPGAPVEMARASNPIDMSDANKPDAIVVSVGRDGRIFLGNEIVTGDVLTQKVHDQLSNRTNKTVYVRADMRVRYKVVAGVVDNVRSASVDQLGLLTEQKPHSVIR